MADLALVEAARSFARVRFQRQGRTRHGLDCVGLLVIAAQAVGVDLSPFDDQTYGVVLPDGKLEAALDQALMPLEPGSLYPGAVALLNVPGVGRTHVGIIGELSGQPSLIHATELRGCVTEHRLDSHLKARVVKTYALPY